MCKYYAQPYNLDAAGFFFETIDEYTEKSEALLDKFGNKVEEYEIQYIDGDLGELFNSANVNQANLAEWFDADLEALEDDEQSAIFYLLDDLGYNLEDAISKYDEVSISEATLQDAASELFDECYAHSIPENIRFYIDYEKLANDCRIAGDMAEFTYKGTTYTCTNAACL